MLLAGICLAAATVAIWRDWRRHEGPLDRAEIQILQRFSDRIRREQVQPFE